MSKSAVEGSQDLLVGNDSSLTNAVGLNDNSKESRIAQRKIRVELNRQAKNRKNENEDSNARRKAVQVTANNDIGKAKAQVGASRKRINAVKQSGVEAVTNVRVNVTARESVRRNEESKKNDVWSTKRKNEKETSESLAGEIEAQWSKVSSNAGPYELVKMLNDQKALCEKLIESKDKLIAEYLADLKAKDDEYVKELKRQADEIDALLGHMETQYKTLHSSLQNELTAIERSFMEERTETLEKNLKEIESLFEQRRNNETKYMEERAAKIEENIQQIEMLRVHDSEDYNLVKIKLETDVQVLEQQLQQMRATYQLNTEKLEYNYQVLKKREEENGTILSAQKRKITRLTDVLNGLRSKIAKQERAFQMEYAGLTEDYKRITEQFKELQKKFRHFQLADAKRYREVWKMNEEVAFESIRKLLQADRIIYEQQLGLEWSMPTDIPMEIEYKHEEISEKKDDGQSSERGSLAEKMKELKGNNKTMKRILELLCNEAGFLVEEKLQKLLAPLHRDERSLMRLDSIFKALGIETIEDIERLTSYFVEDPSSSRRGSVTDSIEPSGTEVQLIHPNECIKAIRRFVEDFHGKKISTPGSIEEADSSSDASDLTDSSREHLGVKPRDFTKDHWNKMANVINDKRWRVWTASYQAMEQYNKLLVSRYSLTKEIDSVSRQNNELKQLLRQYMSSRINEELQIPPTQILLAQAGIAIKNSETHVNGKDLGRKTTNSFVTSAEDKVGKVRFRETVPAV